MNTFILPSNPNKLLSNDQHIGSPEVDYRLISEELVKAKSLHADVLINGDLFDCILPKDSKRYQPAGLHKRLRGRNDVLNEQINWGVEIYSGVKHLIRMVGKGNHEDAIEKWHGTNPIKLFLDRLGIPEVYGHYDGYLKYPESVIYYHHGTGSGTSIGSALGEFEKRMKFIEADIIWMGHKHHRLYGELRKLIPSKKRYRSMKFIMPGSYMDTYSNPQGSYGEDKNYPPQGKGGVFIYGSTVAYE